MFLNVSRISHLLLKCLMIDDSHLFRKRLMIEGIPSNNFFTQCVFSLNVMRITSTKTECLKILYFKLKISIICFS